MLKDDEFVITRDDGTQITCTAVAVLYPPEDNDIDNKYLFFYENKDNNEKKEVKIGEVIDNNELITIKQVTDPDLITILGEKMKSIYEELI